MLLLSFSIMASESAISFSCFNRHVVSSLVFPPTPMSTLWQKIGLYNSEQEFMPALVILCWRLNAHGSSGISGYHFSAYCEHKALLEVPDVVCCMHVLNSVNDFRCTIHVGDAHPKTQAVCVTCDEALTWHGEANERAPEIGAARLCLQGAMWIMMPGALRQWVVTDARLLGLELHQT